VFEDGGVNPPRNVSGMTGALLTWGIISRYVSSGNDSWIALATLSNTEIGKSQREK
jgi:hypothetical protein